MNKRTAFPDHYGLPERAVALFVFIFISVLVAKGVADRVTQDEPWHMVLGLVLFAVFVVVYKVTKKTHCP